MTGFKIEFMIPEIRAQIAKFFSEREVDINKMIDTSIEDIIKTEKLQEFVSFNVTQAIDDLVKQKVREGLKSTDYDDDIKGLVEACIRRVLNLHQPSKEREAAFREMNLKDLERRLNKVIDFAFEFIPESRMDDWKELLR